MNVPTLVVVGRSVPTLTLLDDNNEHHDEKEGEEKHNGIHSVGFYINISISIIPSIFIIINEIITLRNVSEFHQQ